MANNPLNRILTLGVLVIAMLCAACTNSSEAEELFVYNGEPSEWLVEMYICGSDLESEGGMATLNLEEMQKVNLPDNVRVLIMAGGAEEWQNDMMQGGKTGIYLYDKDGLHKLQSAAAKDMGSEGTLADFLQYGKDNFPAAHRMFIFWDHGGGSASGVCADENTNHILSLNDIQKAFSSVYTADESQPGFDVIGFDACLMGTIDVAKCLQGYTSYMVASEEVVPGEGWGYQGWLAALAAAPDMEAKKLGQVICDEYLENCRRQQSDSNVTMSLVDMSKLPGLWAAYEAFGQASLAKAAENPQAFLTSYGRAASKAESYGGNTREQGYSNMVDLGDFALKAHSILPQQSADLRAALHDAIAYRVSGIYRRYGTGLSCYYSYNGDKDDLNNFKAVNAASPSFKALYTYLLTGQIASDEYSHAASNILSQLQALSFNINSLEDKPVDVDDAGNAFVHLTQAEMDMVSEVHFQLAYIDEDDGSVFMLGSDTNIDADWDTGIFKDNFNGSWGCLDGHLAYMEIIEDEDDYNVYAVPIKLNGQKCTLKVAYSYLDEKYHIQGASYGLDNNGMADRRLIQLQPGDEVTMLYYIMEDSSDDLLLADGETFRIKGSPSFEDEDIGDGMFCYMFEFTDPQNNSSLSQVVTFDVKGDTIETSV